MIGYYEQIKARLQGREKPRKITGSLFYQNESFGINDLSFDLLIDETHGVEYDVSEHVIENGDTIADNVRRHLRKVSITGLFTNYPLSTTEYKETDKVELNEEPMTYNRALKSYQELQKIAAQRKPVKLVAALEIYENMVITSLRTTRGPEDGEAVRFEMELQEIKTTGTLTVKYEDKNFSPKEQNTAATRAVAKENNGGNVTGQDADAETMAGELQSINEGQYGGVD